MKGPNTPIFAFLGLLLLTIPYTFDFNTSTAPGWHTTFFPTYFIWGLIVISVLLLVIIGDWLLLKRVDKINWTLFSFHFILTISSMIYLKFPYIFLKVQWSNPDEMQNAIWLRLKLIPIAWTLFIIGQILFAIYSVRTIYLSRIRFKG